MFYYEVCRNVARRVVKVTPTICASDKAGSGGLEVWRLDFFLTKAIDLKLLEFNGPACDQRN